MYSTGGTRRQACLEVQLGESQVHKHQGPGRAGEGWRRPAGTSPLLGWVPPEAMMRAWDERSNYAHTCGNVSSSGVLDQL